MAGRFIHLVLIAGFSLAFVSPCKLSWNFFLSGKKKTGKDFAVIKNEFFVNREADWKVNEYYWPGDSVKIINGTFLGNSQRNYYGDSIGEHLEIIWKTRIGKGQTICRDNIVETWMGAGWTGQPLMVEEKGIPFLVQGCYDHRLKKINAITGEIVWEYPFDDVIKGTGTLYADKERNDLVILQGSRIGFKRNSWQREICSFRAVSFFSGQEVWRMNVRRGPSYSRDVDGSALILNDTGYIGLENGYFTVFDPMQQHAERIRDSFRVKIIAEEKLFSDEDKKHHGSELVTESSPCKIGNHLYITSGSGHVYGFNLETRKIDWDFYLGSDLNGSPVVTKDKCLVITIEKQFIRGMGGVMKIDPSRSPENCVVWFFPTGDKKVSDWKGGIIGSAAVSHHGFAAPSQLCAFIGVDGYFHVVDQGRTETDSLVAGPDSTSWFARPKLLFSKNIGPSISTSLIIGNRIVVAGYGYLKIFEFDELFTFRELASFKGFFESTPFAHKGRIYIASRSGYLYCFGKNNERISGAVKK